MEEQSFDVTIQWTVSSSVIVNNIDKFRVELKQFETSGTYISGSYNEFDVPGEVRFRFDLICCTINQACLFSYRQIHTRIVLCKVV